MMKYFNESHIGEVILSGKCEQYLIPAEYQAVEYLESTGTLYIDTGIVPTNSGGTRTKFHFALNDITNGENQSIGSNNNLNLYADTRTLKFRANGDVIKENLDTDWHIVEMSKSTTGKETIFDGVTYTTSRNGEESNTFCLFGMSASNNFYFGKYKLSYIEIYDNNSLVCDLIPARRKSDNVLGMYDTITGNFLTNQGTGTFIAGADVVVYTGDNTFKGHTEKANGQLVNNNTYNWVSDTNNNLVFPDGMKSAGSVYDEIIYDNGTLKAIKRIGSVDMGTLNWVNSIGATYPYFMANIGHVEKADCKMICVPYDNVTIKNANQNIGISGFNNHQDGLSNVWLRCRDTSYTNVATFKQAMAGVMLYYELDTPVEYTLSVKGIVPTPDNPIDITCNNGVLRARHKSGLPLGYTLLDYIENTSDAYIDTGYYGNLETSVEIEYQHSNDMYFCFGSRTDSQTDAIIVFGFKGFNNDIIGFGTSYDEIKAQRSTTPQRLNVWLKVKLNKHYKEISDGVTTDRFNDEMSTPFTTPSTLMLFCPPSTFPQGYEYMKGKIKSLLITESGLPILNFIPCINPNNVVGMYDTVGGQFYSSPNGTVFIAGAVVDDIEVYADENKLPNTYQELEYIESTGTQYIDTGVTGYIDIELGIKYRITQNNTAGYWAIYGRWENDNSPNLRHIYDSSFNTLFLCNNEIGSGSPDISASSTTPLNTDIVETMNTDGWYINNTFYARKSTSIRTSNIDSILLFNRYASSERGFIGRVYYFILKRAGSILFNGIPCRRNSDNVLGMYDTITGTFFTNQGTGSFIAGPEVIDDNIEYVWARGKNLFDKKFEQTGYYISVNGVITQTHRSESSYTYLIQVLPNTTYTFSSTVPNHDTGANKRIHAYDANGNWIKQLGINSGPSGYYTITFTTPSNCKYVRISMYTIEIESQLEQGSTATSYEPYFNGGTAAAEMLLSVGNYKDTLEVFSGIVTRNVGVYVFDGTENWTKGIAIYADLPINVPRINKPCFCTHYKGVNNSQQGADLEGTYSVCIGASSNDIRYIKRAYFYPNRNDFADTTAWANWLKDQYANGTPVIIVYPLETPVVEQITPQYFESNNVVQIAGSINNLPIDISYLHNLRKCYITDSNGILLEVKHMYIGNNNIYNN